MQNSISEIVLSARRWIDTPYRHAAMLEGVGVDCVGLILGVGLELGYFTEQRLVEFRQTYGGYARTPNPRRMRQGMVEYLDPLPNARSQIPPDGSIGWFQWRDELPMHLGIIATFENRRTMIHAYSVIGRAVENTLDELWISRLNSWWRYKDGEV